MKALSLIPTNSKESHLAPFASPFLALPVQNGYQLAKESDIMYCEAQGSYTLVFFEDGSKLLLSRRLKIMENKLSIHSFVRIHQSYLVNKRFMFQYQRSNGGKVILKNGVILPVSQSQKTNLLACFKIL